MKRTCLVLVSLLIASLVGCEGSTGGSEDKPTGFDAAGSLGTLRLDIKNLRPNVADRVGFIVTLLDASGAPVPFVRIACDTEQGIAILEPSDNGVAFENTDANGTMSGVLGAVAPGSYLVECRAPNGFGLRERATMVVGGTIPAGFEGFDGAAGGNLGGGAIVDPGSIDGNGVSISGFQTVDASGPDTTGPEDLTQNPDCDGDPDTSDPEPFTFVDAIISINNSSAQNVVVTGFAITVQQPTPAFVSTNTNSTEGLFSPVTIAKGSSADISLFLADPNQNYVGTSIPPLEGVWRVDIVVTLENADGESFTTTGTAQIAWDNVNNCTA